MSRPCDAVGYTKAVSAGRFMCITHWRAVPQHLQNTINTRYYQASRKTGGIMRDMVYLEACAVAIEHLLLVGALADSSPPNPYRRILKLLQQKGQANANTP